MPEPLEPRLNEIAVALAALAPHPPALDRDRLLYRAGRASAPRPWLWRLTATVSTTLAAVLGAALIFRPAPAPAERIIVVRVEPAAPAPPNVPAAPAAPAESAPPAVPLDSWPSTPYTRLEDRVLRWGLDGLAEPPAPPAAAPDTVDSLLKSL